MATPDRGPQTIRQGSCRRSCFWYPDFRSALRYWTSPPPPIELGYSLTLLLKEVASFVGGYGFALLFNSPARTALAVGLLALAANEFRLMLFDAGMALAPATFFGALAIGLVLCS